LLALIIAAALLPACKDNRVCGGFATCFGAQPSQCQNIPGCSATPGCMLNPVTGDDCMTATTQADCAARSAIAGCAWANGACAGFCNAITAEAMCTNATVDCIWSACTGMPKPCDQYSADSCPRSPLGCYVATPE